MQHGYGYDWPLLAEERSGTASGKGRGMWVQTNDPQAEDLVRSHATKLNISRAFNLRV